MKWDNIPLEEQETIINFDYYGKQVNIYTSRGIVYNKFHKKIGEPIQTHTNNGKVYCADWKIPFSDRKTISKALTLANLLMIKQKDFSDTIKSGF